MSDPWGGQTPAPDPWAAAGSGATAPPGWYPDPRTGASRWWDGAAWGVDAPPQAAPAPYGRPPHAPGTNGLAIASLVLGIVCMFWLGSILAVVFGHVALSQVRRSGEGGRGLAIAGLVLGYIGVAALVAFIVLAVVAGHDSQSCIEYGQGSVVCRSGTLN